MTTAELKRRIASGELAPPWPGVARVALTAREGVAQDLHRLLEAARLDPALSRAFQYFPPIEQLEYASALSTLPEVRRNVLRHTVEQLFPAKEGNRLDRQSFWRHAFAAAQLAERLARQIDSRFVNEAYGAGLLHDVGKLILDLAVPDGYSKALEVARSQALYTLDAERRELGVDHTLAGKWVAEYWGLPHPFSAAIWLHHHPIHALDELLYPGELVGIVALASLLARSLLTGLEHEQILDSAEDLRKGLNLSREALASVIDQKLDEPAQTAETPRETARADAGEGPASLQRKLQRMGVIQEMCLSLKPTMDPVALLKSMAISLREAFLLPSGLCYASEIDESGLIGAIWRAGDATPQSVFMPFEIEENTVDPLCELLANVLAESRRPDGFLGHGLVAVPIVHEGMTLGQAVFDAPNGLLKDEDLRELLDFGRTCGWLLAVCQERRRVSEQSEMLSTSLWRHELTHRQALRAERLAGLGQLASGAAHVINNPLTAISGRAQMLLSRASGPEEVRSLETIIYQSRRIHKILNDLMQFARPTEPHLENAQISFILHQVCCAMRERLTARGIQVIEDYVQSLPHTRVDRRQLEQVFVNLILNAEQAMPSGGTLTLAVKSSQDHRSVVVQVSDTGQGIPSDVIDRIFEPFFTTREGSENTGLGLSVCHGIIERHRGALTMHSAAGTGATCTITLPAVLEVSEFGGAGAPQHLLSTVLVAETDPDLREVLVHTLKLRGYEVVAASDGLEAFSDVLSRSFDLIILNAGLTLPGGVLVLEQLCTRKINIPIIALSDTSVGYDSKDILAMGAVACLQKPFPIERLLACIQQALASRHAAA
jgi:signal transduction histidine kinase/response regulator RpfG family c-di-GMP phosphodiesterase